MCVSRQGQGPTAAFACDLGRQLRPGRHRHRRPGPSRRPSDCPGVCIPGPWRRQASLSHSITDHYAAARLRFRIVSRIVLLALYPDVPPPPPPFSPLSRAGCLRRVWLSEVRVRHMVEGWLAPPHPFLLRHGYPCPYQEWSPLHGVRAQRGERWANATQSVTPRSRASSGGHVPHAGPRRRHTSTRVPCFPTRFIDPPEGRLTVCCLTLRATLCPRVTARIPVWYSCS